VFPQAALELSEHHSKLGGHGRRVVLCFLHSCNTIRYEGELQRIASYFAVAKIACLRRCVQNTNNEILGSRDRERCS
jgi:hypothetical protein